MSEGGAYFSLFCPQAVAGTYFELGPSFKYNVCAVEETASYNGTTFCAKVNFDHGKLEVDLLT